MDSHGNALAMLDSRGLPEGVLFLRKDPRVGVAAELADAAVEFLTR